MSEEESTTDHVLIFFRKEERAKISIYNNHPNHNVEGEEEDDRK